jgi:hypothetical protein
MFNVQASANKPAETAPQPEPEPVRLERPTPEIELAVETIALPTQPVFSAAAAESAGFGTTCDVSGTLARAFGENEFIKGELARIGPESRSISNAIMFWNAAWVELPGDAPKDAVEMLRRAIVEGVRAAPPECLAQELAGPRFIIVGDTSRATMLVLGSGTWRWEQLLKGVEDGPHLVPPTQLERKD